MRAVCEQRILRRDCAGAQARLSFAARFCGKYHISMTYALAQLFLRIHSTRVLDSQLFCLSVYLENQLCLYFFQKLVTLGNVCETRVRIFV